MSAELREFHTLGATGTVRAEMHEGREHLVVPVIALMQGVIHAVNAQHSEFVPIECLAQSPYGWNGRPVVLGHPTKDGIQISANDPKVLAAHQFGVIFQSHIAGHKLGLEAWIDPKRLETLGQHELLADIRAGKPIEVSVGAFVKTLAEEGNYNGKPYKARWASLLPDHLAFLPKSRGACSIEMGCGAHRAAEEFRAAGGPGSGWHAEDGHVPGSQGGKGGNGDGIKSSSKDFKEKAAAAAHSKAAIKKLKESGFVKGDTFRNSDETGKTTTHTFSHPNGQVAEVSVYHDSGGGHPGRGGTGQTRSSVDVEVFDKPDKKGTMRRLEEFDEEREYALYQLTDEGFLALGGPGSGWHAEDGHVPGSQGGKGSRIRTDHTPRTKAQAEKRVQELRDSGFEAHVVPHQDPDKHAVAFQEYSSARSSPLNNEFTKRSDPFERKATRERNAQLDKIKRASRLGDHVTANRLRKLYGLEEFTMDELETLGGPGSGWHAEDGHVPGSQGGKGTAGHMKAQRSHEKAAELHEKAAASMNYHDSEAAMNATDAATSQTKTTGAKPYSAHAARTYAARATGKGDHSRSDSHREAAKYHRSAAKDHKIAASWGVKHLEEGSVKRSLKDRLVALLSFGKVPETEEDLLEVLAGKKKDCEACKTSGSVSGNPCEACNGKGYTMKTYEGEEDEERDTTLEALAEELKTLIGARNSASDLTKIQTVHDYAVALGAECGSHTAAEEHGGSTAEGDNQMDKTQKDGIIKHLSECPCSGFTKDDVKFLEGLPDQRLQTLEENAKAGEKVAADLKAAQEKAKEQELKIKGLETKTLTEAEVVAALPAHLKTLLEKAKVHTETRTAELLKALEEPTKGIFTTDELKAKSLEDLEKLATLAGLTSVQNTPSDYSAARPMPRMAGEVDLTIPPDPYAAGIKALQERDKTTH